MASNISYNPLITTNAAGLFAATSAGYMQGIAEDDPAIRNALAGGYLSGAETLPMWGGVAISEDIPASTADSALGGAIARATAIANLTGFSVFNQAHAWISSPQSECPSAGAGMTIPFYRLGSGARIPLACDPSLISLGGGLITQQVSWDFNNQRLQPYDAATGTVSITSMTASFANGVYTIAVVCAAASLVGAVGDAINISGATNSGTGGAGLVNGNFSVTSFTDNEHFSFQVSAASGAIGTIGGTMLLNEGVGALPVKVLKLSVGNSKIVSYDPVNNFVHWSPNGSAALCLI